MALAPDAVGHWPRFPAPVRGKAAYVKVIADVISLVPDRSIDVAEHATSGEFVFVRWVARGTFRGKRFESNGIDRVHVRNGIVLENYICSDHPMFEQVAAMNSPQA